MEGHLEDPLDPQRDHWERTSLRGHGDELSS